MNNQDTQAVQTTQSWFNFSTATLREWWNSLNITPDKIVELLYYLGIGFALGFFFKKFGRGLFLFLLLLALIGAGLHYFGYMSIDWLRIKSDVGIGPSGTVDTLIGQAWLWIKGHVGPVLMLVIGFLLGSSIG